MFFAFDFWTVLINYRLLFVAFYHWKSFIGPKWSWFTPLLKLNSVEFGLSDAGSNFDNNGNLIFAKSTSYDFSPKWGQKLLIFTITMNIEKLTGPYFSINNA